MKVAILGSGDVAKVLAAGFQQHGHRVRMGARKPSKLTEWAAENPAIETGGLAEAGRFGEWIVLAVNGLGAADALRVAGARNLAGKLVIDITNPIADVPPVNGVLQFFTTLDDSLMERLQREFPEAHFVKAFNAVGKELMVNPQLAGGRPTMFICGNDEAAKEAVRGILDAFGWDAADMGRVEAARAIEPLCMLWCIPGFLRGEWRHAFKLLR